MSESCDRYLAEQEDRLLEELHAFLRIPSISALPAHHGDVLQAAEWVATRLRQIGVPEVETRTVVAGAPPIVLGRWHISDHQPTVLIYAHYDVQPPDPLDLWESPPFEPTVRDGRIYARGAADDKAGLFLTTAAVEAMASTAGAPPVNVIFCFEGEEEVGSPNLSAFVQAERERLACDVFLSADGSMWSPDQTVLTLSTKGLAGCQIDLRTGQTDLHSGEYGAAVPNAAQVAARLGSSFHDETGRVAVAGFYDRVRDLSAEERAELAAVPFDDDAFTGEVGTAARWGEPGWSALERRWARPTVDINGIWGGFQGAGAKTVTPCEAHLKITCRLVPDQEPSDVLDLLERHVAAHCPPGVEAIVQRQPGSARPFAIDRDDPGLATARQVLRDLFGKEPLVIRSGGTLPVAEVFQSALGVDMVFFAWSLPDSKMHAPNEWFRVEDVQRGARAYCAYLSALAR